MINPLSKSVKYYGKNSLKKIKGTVLPPIMNTNEVNKSSIKRGRDKLADLLALKYIDKYGLSKRNADIINKEVLEFVSQEKLTQKMLTHFDKQLRRKMKDKTKSLDLKGYLIKNDNNSNKYVITECPQKPKLQTIQYDSTDKNTMNIYNSYTNIKDQIAFKNNNYNTIDANPSNIKKDIFNVSKMTGASNLEKFDIKLKGSESEKANLCDIKSYLNDSEEIKPQKIVLHYSKYKDEWDAINMFNLDQFEKQKKLNRHKDMQIKFRTRAELDYQIKEKAKRKQDEILQSLEYDKKQQEYLNEMAELEKQKKIELRNKALKEKEMREQQIKDKLIVKQIEELKNKKYEKELLENNQKEIELEKAKELKLRQIAHEAFLETIKEADEHKRKIAEALIKEKENDSKMLEDELAMELKQDNERKLYYKSIERSSNEFAKDAIEEVLRTQEERRQKDEEDMKECQQKTLEREILEEQKRKENLKELKKRMRNFYDMQVKEKKKRMEFEKNIDLVQSDIWNRDNIKYNNEQKEINKIIRGMNMKYRQTLLDQINYKKNQEENNKGMSDNEKLMNRELLEKVNNNNNNN